MTSFTLPTRRVRDDFGYVWTIWPYDLWAELGDFPKQIRFGVDGATIVCDLSEQLGFVVTSKDGRVWFGP